LIRGGEFGANYSEHIFFCECIVCHSIDDLQGQNQVKKENKMRKIKSLKISSMVWYGAVLVAFWTFAIGLYYWILGWIFGAQSWWIDVTLASWTEYTIRTLLSVIWRALLNGVGGALAGLVIALVYNAVAGMMGGIQIELE